MHFELGHEVRPMNFHRSSRYVEIIGDGLVGKAVGEADENLSFARREHGDPHPRLRLSKRPRVGLIETRESHADRGQERSEEHTSELQSLLRTRYAVICLKKIEKRSENKSITNATKSIT